MVNFRFEALKESGQRQIEYKKITPNRNTCEIFGNHIFNEKVMKAMLSKPVFENVLEAMASKDKIKPEFADEIAKAIKDWAIQNGATHYTHWFQPLTGTSAEKHDAFLDWSEKGEVIENFTGKQLIQGEPDASSFPSGGLRSTYEARGYTGWDPTSPIFLWKAGDGITLCIPTVFFSWTGEVLDLKIPLLRSDEKLNQAVLRLLNLTKIKANRVYSTLGLEQEYFVIDRALRNLRPDLLLLGKTVFGSYSPKGQELQDHYLGSVKDRVLAYMHDFETEAIKLGIPVKTRHNEVAPAQHEVAPVYEKASKAIDHNILLMELMRHIAVKHNLACLLHEKPFKGLNGSGKHSNWSIATDTGINLLDPSDAPGDNLHFLILLTAILHAVHQHSGLLRASIGSASNDDRLGGHEAPPAIMSIYLGEELENVLENIEEKGIHNGGRKKTIYDLGLPIIPDLKKENTDRNRTSPFAFTGNKFEFRAVGSSCNPSFPVTVLNVIVANSLQTILDEIEANAKKPESNFIQAAIPVIRKYLKLSKPIRYSGDNYSDLWKKEAIQRELPNYEKAIYAFENLTSKSTLNVFKDVLTEQELKSRYEIAQETYLVNLHIEINLMLDMFHTQVLPAAIVYQKNLAKSIEATRNVLESSKGATISQSKLLKELAELIEQGIDQAEDLKHCLQKSFKGSIGEKAQAFVEYAFPKMKALRSIVDYLERMVDDQIWPLPKYREILFIV